MHFKPDLTQVTVPLFYLGMFETKILGRAKKFFQERTLLSLLFILKGLEYHVKLIKFFCQSGPWIFFMLGLIPFEGIEQL